MMMRLSTLALVLLAAACSKDAPPPFAYDRSCTSVADCVPLYIGALGCCGTPCPNTAVNASVADKASKDVEAARMCTAPPPCPFNPNMVCPDRRVQCTAGSCVLEPPPDAGGQP